MSGDDENNNNKDDDDDWSCCNDAQTLFILLYIAFAAIALISLPIIFFKPIRLVSTFLHEMSHAVACWITGGDVVSIQVFHNEGGVTQYRGGCRCLIIPAGYVGCGLWAMVWVILSGGRKTATAAAVIFTSALLIALCYTPNSTMVYLNIGYAVVLIACIVIEWFYYTPLLQFVILFFGVSIGIVAVSDIYSDTIMRSIKGSDSYACYSEVCCRTCPPRCIGLQWILVAIFFQIFGVWIALVEMSNECEDVKWFTCLNQHWTLFDNFDLGEKFDFDGFWDNGP